MTWGLLVVSAGLVVVFVLLGNWQVKRLTWKNDLIATVDTRAFGVPTTLPPIFRPETHEYLRVRVSGTPLEHALLVKAVTELGPGYWVMTPYQVGADILWINRGFVPNDRKDPANWTAPKPQLTGLLRPTAPDGTLLEPNRPDIDRWVSRDTAAMSSRLGLGRTRTYFLDADHDAAPDTWPRGGMTVIAFPNNHLSYALTWYAMALLFALTVAVMVVRVLDVPLMCWRSPPD
nr:SURF1 family cytochrome oxidase biogenesis protein [Thalassobius sp. Cn5-15]